MGDIATNVKPRSYYDCVDCPAYCCSVYERVQVTPRDVRRLAEDLLVHRVEQVVGREDPGGTRIPDW